MTALLETRGLGRSFAGTVALDGVDFAAEAGEVHAIVGANGAGKSTLMNLLAGVFPPSRGEIRLDGREVAFASPREAGAAGISIVYQELTVLPLLTVAENIFLGHERRGRFGLVNRARLAEEASRLCAHWRLPLDPSAVAGALSVAQQQLVELARALSVAARILILDEPTSVLSLAERDALFAIIGELRRRGLLVVYVTHRLEEVFAIADRVTVLRNGKKIATHAIGEIDQAGLVRLMVGRDLGERLDLPPVAAAPPFLEVAIEGRRFNSAFAVRCGEILGLAGLVGSGRTRLARGIAAIEPDRGLRLRIEGREVSLRSPAEALRHGIVYLTEDRKRDGLFLDLPVLGNASAASLARFSRGGLLRRAAEREAVGGILERLRLVARSLAAPVRQLSGGNQQKVLFGRALLCAPRLLICDEPTRGVDVGAKEEIYRILVDLAAAGVAILLISSEMKELMALSHRLLVVRDGGIVREMPPDSGEEAVLMAATGAATGAAPEAGPG